MIFFVGPLPPPMHGFSFVNSAMLRHFEAQARVAVFDRAHSGRVGWPSRLRHGLSKFGRFIRALLAAKGTGSMYIGLSGGAGQLLDLVYIVAAGGTGRPVVIHHHSFAYLRRKTWYSSLCLRPSTGVRHIVLCECMAALLSSAYKIESSQIDIVSNAAFLPALPTGETGWVEAPAVRLRLGFLSNITLEKGIFIFFDLVAALAARGIAVEGVVAGPVAGDIARRFERRLGESPWCRHLGAVYGSDKDAFFAGIDVLVFPTIYDNEAEPVSVLEALRAGVPVVANQRGCIAEMIPAGAGAVFDDDSRFVEMAAARLAEWFGESAEQWSARRTCAQQAFRALHADHLQRVEGTVRRICGSAKAHAC